MTGPQQHRRRGVTAALGLAIAALLLGACGGDGDNGEGHAAADEAVVGETPPGDSEVEDARGVEDADVDTDSLEVGADRDTEGSRTLRQPTVDEDAPAPASTDETSGADQLETERNENLQELPTVPSSPEAGSGPSTGETRGLNGRVIALDPGHNGGNFDAPEQINRPVDAGGFTKPCNTTGTATEDGYRESTFNLEVVELLRARLEEAGADVHLTRTDDDGVGPCIDVRGSFGQRVGADLTISIHADGAGAGARGFHIIHPASWSGSDPAVLDASRELAAVLRDVLVEHGKSPANYVGTDGLVARNDLATLNLSEVPVVLLEAGNMRNAEDAAQLRDPRWQARFAEALADAVERYLAGSAL